MNIFEGIFEEILVIPAYRLWQELFGEENQEDQEDQEEEENEEK